MKKLFYFETIDSEICYHKDHFIDNMAFEGLTEMNVYEAIPDKIPGIFWCKHECFCGDDSRDSCGKQCKAYAPRNGKSGCCRHYTTRMYLHGEKITLNINN